MNVQSKELYHKFFTAKARIKRCIFYYPVPRRHIHLEGWFSELRCVVMLWLSLETGCSQWTVPKLGLQETLFKIVMKLWALALFGQHSLFTDTGNLPTLIRTIGFCITQMSILCLFQLGRQRKYPITRWDSNARPLDREACPLSLCYDHSPSSIVRYISFSKRSKSGRTCNRLIMSTSELGLE